MTEMKFVYDHENKRAVTEVYERKELDKEVICKCFDSKPVYMIINFHGPLDEDDLSVLYLVCTNHNLFEVDVAQAIQEDLKKQPMGAWYIRCYNFRDAFEAAIELTTKDFEDLWVITLTEETPLGFKKKRRRLKNGGKLADNNSGSNGDRPDSRV